MPDLGAIAATGTDADTATTVSGELWSNPSPAAAYYTPSSASTPPTPPTDWFSVNASRGSVAVARSGGTVTLA